MARSSQVAIAADGNPHQIAPPPVGADRDSEYGNTFVLYNIGSVTVELGGSDVAGNSSFRGFLSGATLVIEMAEGEVLYGRVSGGVAGAVDVLAVS